MTVVRDRLRLPCAFCDWRCAEDDRLGPPLACFLPFRVPFLDVDLDFRLPPELLRGGCFFFAGADTFLSFENSFCTARVNPPYFFFFFFSVERKTDRAL